MADKRDYYEVLGIPKDATDAQIKSAFRKKAKECHPDLHPGDKAAEAQFKELNEAAEVLSDPDKRARYDQFGHAAFEQGGGAGANPFSGGGFGDFGDILDQVFGGGFGGGFGGTRSRTGPMQGEDLRYSMTISFTEAAFGVSKEIVIPREDVCSSCGGSGAKAGSAPEKCKTCNGTGQVRTQQNTMFGSFASTRPCTTCRGTGKVISNPCDECRGTGRVRRNERTAIRVPAGIDNGQTICMQGKGSAGQRGGPNGDLYITISVRDHDVFRRRGFDLYLDMTIPYATAVLGGKIVVPTLKESVETNIAAGTQSGTIIRLREQGVKRLNASGTGDLLLTVTIDVPKRLTEEQRALLRKYAEACGDQTAQVGKKGIFGKNRRD